MSEIREKNSVRFLVKYPEAMEKEDEDFTINNLSPVVKAIRNEYCHLYLLDTMGNISEIDLFNKTNEKID